VVKAVDRTKPKGKKYEGGGKVESNPYGWPTTNARGKK
jgi:hypothetical protein